MYTLSQPNTIRGGQLADEINKALGTSISTEDVLFYEPDQVQVLGIEGREQAVQAVVSAHMPNATYFQAERDDASALTVVLNMAQTAVGVSLTALTATQQRSLLAVLLWRAGGVTADGKVRPLNQWAKRG